MFYLWLLCFFTVDILTVDILTYVAKIVDILTVDILTVDILTGYRVITYILFSTSDRKHFFQQFAVCYCNPTKSYQMYTFINILK